MTAAFALVALALSLVAPPAFDHDHSKWSAILAAHVSNGRVDYAGLHKGGGPKLDAYLRTLEAVSKGELAAWTKPQRLAFWINAYNAYTIKLIVEHYPIKSIREIGFLPYAAFRDAFIGLDRIWGKEMSLDDIEHRILRERFDEPRIHFAIVCASKSCPKLQSEAFTAKKLEGQLKKAARGFLTDARRNRYVAAEKTVYLSKIFKWFGEDFEKAAGSVKTWVLPYFPPMERKAIESKETRVEFLDYDWSLNGR